MVTIFIIFLLAVLFAWQGKRKIAFCFFGLSLLSGVVVFIHHITSHLNIDL